MTKPWEQIIKELREHRLFTFENEWYKDDIDFAIEIQSKLSKWSRLPIDALSNSEVGTLSYLPFLDEHLQ